MYKKQTFLKRKTVFFHKMDSTILDGNTTNQIGTKTASSGTNTLMVLTLDLVPLGCH